MSAQEIIAELTKLNPAELKEVRESLWQIEEATFLSNGGIPSKSETELLDQELAEYDRHPQAGSDWEEVKSRLKR